MLNVSTVGGIDGCDGVSGCDGVAGCVFSVSVLVITILLRTPIRRGVYQEEHGENEAVRHEGDMLHYVKFFVVVQDHHGNNTDQLECNAGGQNLHRHPLPGESAQDQ